MTRRAVAVGCGWIAETWLNALRERGDVDVVAFVDPDAAAAEDRRRLWGSGEVFHSWTAAIAATGADLALNLTPPDEHVATSVACLDAGCDVLTEKPLAPDAEGALAIAACADRVGRRVLVLQNRRHEAGFRALLDATRRLPAGPRLLSVAMLTDWRFGGFRDEMANPLLRDMAIHFFDQGRALAASPPTWVSCHQFSIGGSWMAGDATMIAQFAFADGSALDCRSTWTAWGHETSWNGRWDVVGAGAALSWDGEGAPELHAPALDERGCPDGEPPAPQRLPLASTGTGHEAALDEMLGALAAGTPSETECQDNLLSVAMVDAAERSAAEHRRVAISEVM
jgi:predicted dehydrogenase